MHRRHDPTYYWATRRLPRRDPARHARPVRLRAHRRRDRRRPAAGPPAPEARRAALDAWERELARRPGAGPLPAPGGRRAGRRRPPPPPAARRAAHLHALDAHRLRAGADRHAGRSSRPTWTARRARSAGSWRRCSACPARHHADFGRLGLAFQLTNFIRDVREDTRARPRSTCPPTDRARFGVAERDLARGARDARAARAGRASRCAARAALFAEAEPAVAAAPALRAHRRPLRRRRSTCACSTASSGSSSTCSAAAPRVRAWQLPGAALGALRRMTRRATLRGAERTPLGATRARRRARLRRELRRARRRARAGGQRRRRARRRPLRDRRAPDVGVRGADAVAAGDGRARAIRQELPCMAFHTPHGSARFRLPWSWSSFDYRTLCERAVGAVRRRALRDREGRAARAERRRRPVRTDRGDAARAAGRRRARLAPRARRRAERPAARRADLARPRGASRRRGGDADLDVWIDRSLVRRGYAWSVPAGGRAARRRRLLRAARPRQGADAGHRRPARRRRRCATRATGSRTRCGRRPRTACSSSATAPATASRCRARGSAPRSTSASPAGASCGACWPARRTRDAGARRLRRVLGARTRRAFAIALRLQRLIPALPPRLLTALLAVVGRERAVPPGVRVVPGAGAPALRVACRAGGGRAGRPTAGMRSGRPGSATAFGAGVQPPQPLIRAASARDPAPSAAVRRRRRPRAS